MDEILRCGSCCGRVVFKRDLAAPAVLIMGIERRELDHVRELFAADIIGIDHVHVVATAVWNYLDPADAAGTRPLGCAQELFDLCSPAECREGELLGQMSHPGTISSPPGVVR